MTYQQVINRLDAERAKAIMRRMGWRVVGSGERCPKGVETVAEFPHPAPVRARIQKNLRLVNPYPVKT